MLSGCEKISIPFFSHNQQEFDAMKVEQWPIIQAYALEGYGRSLINTVENC